jgi:D-serine deaminase-like pyridoxal phosphate-dependent protein
MVERDGGMDISMLETPCIVADMDKVRANQKIMAFCARTFGCSLRPHIKTHKIPELALLQLKGGADGITCAKVSEAEVMSDGGVDDIFIAYPLAGDFRIRRAIRLSKRVKRLILGVDSWQTAKLLSDAAVAESLKLEVRLEVDTGLHRTGAAYDAASELALSINSMPGLLLTGIYTFRGLVLDGKASADNEAAGRQEGEMLVSLADEMRSAGLDIRDVSGGSTPTGRFVAQVPGVTEIRPGTYIFQDYMQVMENSCRIEDCAAYVLVTVVSTPDDGYAVIDGGSKTFATDFQLGIEPFNYDGYGIAAGNPDLLLARVNEEHGIIVSQKGSTGLRVGQRIKIVPTHICSTVNLHNSIWLSEQGVLRKVPVAARGMLV